METFTKVAFLSVGCLVAGLTLAIWMAGSASKETVLQGLAGVLIMSQFLFLFVTAAKMPFVGFKKSLFAFGLIVLVVFFSIIALDILEGIKEAGSLSELTGLSPFFILGSSAIVLIAYFSS